MSTETEALREQFEAWARKNELEAERHKYADDQYDDHAATSAWWAWRDAFQAGHAAAKAETADPVVGRWYFVANDGAATLCVDETDARESASDADIAFPRMAPHHVTQLVSASQLAAAVAAERERASVLYDMLLNRPALNAGLESEYAAEAAAKAADVGEPVAMVQCHGSAEHPLYTADQLAAAVAAERGKCAGIVNELRMECARRNMPESATMLWHAEDAIRAGAKEPSDG